MDTWDGLSADSLSAAKLLLDHSRFRSSVSRAYYAAYAGFTASLRRSGVTVGVDGRTNPGHDQLQQLVRHNLEPRRFNEGERKEQFRRLRNLWRARVSADYDPVGFMDQSIARDCVRAAAAVQRDLET